MLFLDAFMDLYASHENRQAALLLTQSVEKMKLNGDFEEIDLFFQECDVGKYPRLLHIGMIMNTWHGSEYLHYRQDYIERVKSVLLESFQADIPQGLK